MIKNMSSSFFMSRNNNYNHNFLINKIGTSCNYSIVYNNLVDFIKSNNKASGITNSFRNSFFDKGDEECCCGETCSCCEHRALKDLPIKEEVMAKLLKSNKNKTIKADVPLA
jgi:hypothetical protein